MKLGDVLRKERERRGLSASTIARQLEISPEGYLKIEAGDSGFEEFAALIVKFAKAVEQPVNNLFYPCGLPFLEMEDYEIRVRR